MKGGVTNEEEGGAVGAEKGEIQHSNLIDRTHLYDGSTCGPGSDQGVRDAHASGHKKCSP